jgi:hypothetical protein
MRLLAGIVRAVMLYPKRFFSSVVVVSFLVHKCAGWLYFRFCFWFALFFGFCLVVVVVVGAAFPCWIATACGSVVDSRRLLQLCSGVSRKNFVSLVVIVDRERAPLLGGCGSDCVFQHSIGNLGSE